MKKIIVHPLDTPLGIGMTSISKELKAKKQAYIVPSAILIKQIKELFAENNPVLLSKIEFLTFDQLTRKLTVNQEKKHLLTVSEQELLVKLAVSNVYKSGEINYFKDSMSKTGWLHQIELWIGEIKRAGVHPAYLSKLWKEETVKLRELSRIYSAYQSLLQEYGLIDHEEPYFNLLSDKENLELDYKGITIEQFYDFSPIQMNVLNALGDRNIDINIHLSIDQSRGDLFKWTSNTINYLTSLGFEKQTYTEEPKNIVPNLISYLKSELFSSNPNGLEKYLFEGAKKPIHLITAAGKKQEIEMIATEIKDLFHAQQTSVNDIAIIVPNLNVYQDTMEKLMIKAGIPLKLGKKERLIDNPMIQSLVSLLRAFHGIKKDWISTILSPYFTWSKQINLNHWLSLFRAMGYPMNHQTWNERFLLYNRENQFISEQKEDYDEVMQQLYQLVRKAPKKGNYTQYVQFLTEIENELHVKENVKNQFLYNATDPTSYRDIRAYEALDEIKNELSSLDRFYDENETVRFGDWIQSFILALEKREYEFNQGKKEGVNILSPNQIRGQKFRNVFILGLVEGEFPRAIKNNWLLPDQERLSLRENNVLLNTSRDFENQQKYHFFQSISAAEDKLYLIYSSKTEDGKERLRSFFIDEIVELVGEENINKVERDNGDLIPKNWLDCVYDKQLINKALVTLAQHNLLLSDEEHQFIEEIVNRYNEKLKNINQGINSELDRWKSESNHDGFLIDNTNIQMIREKIEHKVWSNTRLNEAMRCRFAYFANDILKLTEWEEQEESINPIEKGDLMHRILQRFFQTFKIKYGKLLKVTEKDALKEQLLKIAEEEWQLFIQKEYRYLDPIRSEMDYQQLIKVIGKILEHELSWREKAESYFYPHYLEFSFGNSLQEEWVRKEEVDSDSTSEIAQLNLVNHTLSLRGKIDRIDINDKGQFVIYDYKSGMAPANKEIKEGIHLQLPLYILVAEELLGLKSDNAIGAAFYTTSNRHNGFWKMELLKTVGLSSRIGSKYSEDEWRQWLEGVKYKVDQLIFQLKAGDFSVLPTNECPRYCLYQHICRKDDERIKGKMQVGEDKNGISING